MKIKHFILVIASILLMSSSNVWAKKGDKGGPKFDPPKKERISGPEINAASATIPIALLTGIILLMKEKTRSSRYSRTEV